MFMAFEYNLYCVWTKVNPIIVEPACVEYYNIYT